MPDKLIPGIKEPLAIKMPLPSYIQIEPTFKCNLLCSNCFRTSYKREKMNLDPALFKLILEQLPDLKVIKLQGLGETLLYDHLETILTYGKERNIEFITISNGTMISEKNSDFLLSYFSNFYLSLDSLLPERFSKIRGKSNLEEILKNFKILSNKKEKYKTKLGINFVITHENYDEIKNLADFVREYSIDIITLVEIENWFLPSQKEYKNTMEYIKKSREFSSVIRVSVIELMEEMKKTGTEAYFIGSEKRKERCLWPFYLSCITCDGYVIPCCTRANTELSGLGNVRETDFKDIWNSTAYMEIREAIIKNKPSFTCDTCPD